MKATKQALQSLLQSNMTEIKTWLSGYPFSLKNAWCPLVCIYSANEVVKYKANIIYSSMLTIEIRIGVDASNETASADRGMANEDFLNDRASEIKNALFKTPQLDGQTILKEISPIQYRNNRELMVREAVVQVKYEKYYQAQ